MLLYRCIIHDILYFIIKQIQSWRNCTMPRPKGSKNKTKAAKMDFAAAIEAKAAEKAQLEQNISETLDQINSLKAQLKANRAALKAAEKAIDKLESKKASADAKAAMDAQKNELDSAVQKLLADGMSMDEILGKLNG